MLLTVNRLLHGMVGSGLAAEPWLCAELASQRQSEFCIARDLGVLTGAGRCEPLLVRKSFQVFLVWFGCFYVESLISEEMFCSVDKLSSEHYC